MPIDSDFAGDVLGDLETGTYTVIRRPRRQRVDGVTPPHKESDRFEIGANVQQATNRQLKRLPEGRQTTETRAVRTTTELFVGGQESKFEADQLDLDDGSGLWEVQAVGRWPGYFEALIQRVTT